MDENIVAFAKEHKSLFWYTPEERLSQISLSFLIETILNYGTLNDVRELFRLVGIKNVADMFFESIRRSERCNYFPDVKNFFTLYFNKHVGGENIDSQKLQTHPYIFNKTTLPTKKLIPTLQALTLFPPNFDNKTTSARSNINIQ